MELECPYCKSDLIEGYIDSGRYVFKWHNNDMKLIEKITVFGGETLSVNPRIKSYRCKNCNKIIVDLNELENSD